MLDIRWETDMRHNPHIPTEALVSSIMAAIETHGWAYYGLRIEDERCFAVGDYLPDSRLWIDGDPTDEMIDGVSTYGIGETADADKIGKALAAMACYFGDRLILVGGTSRAYGEDSGEWIIRNAKCVGCW